MGDSLLKSDVFFFITTVAVVVISLIFVISLLYLIKILRIIKHVSERAEQTVELIASDVVKARRIIKTKPLAKLWSLFKRNKND